MIRILTVTTIALAAVWCGGCEDRGEAAHGAATGGGDVAAGAAGTQSPALVPLGLSFPTPTFNGTPLPLSWYRGVPNLEDRSRWRPKRGPFLVPPGTTNIALGQFVASNDPQPIIGELAQITDGQKEGCDGYFVELWAGWNRNRKPVPTWVQIDLQNESSIYAVLIWRGWGTNITLDMVVQLSNDPDFAEGVVTVFNNDHDNSSGLGLGHDKAYVESYQGKLIDCKGFTARYVRLYSRGSHRSGETDNQYVEVEVHGRALAAPPVPTNRSMPTLEIDLPQPGYCE